VLHFHDESGEHCKKHRHPIAFTFNAKRSTKKKKREKQQLTASITSSERSVTPLSLSLMTAHCLPPPNTHFPSPSTLFSHQQFCSAGRQLFSLLFVAKLFCVCVCVCVWVLFACVRAQPHTHTHSCIRKKAVFVAVLLLQLLLSLLLLFVCL